MGVNTTTRKRKAAATVRAQRAIELTIDGHSTAAIAKELGIDPRSVRRLVDKTLHELVAAGAEEMRKVLSARANRAAATAASLLDDPDKRVRLEAARTLTRTVAVHAKLFGLERKTLVIEPPAAPTTHDLTRLSPDEVWTLRQLQQKATPGTTVVVEHPALPAIVAAMEPLQLSDGNVAPEQKPNEADVDVELDDL